MQMIQFHWQSLEFMSLHVNCNKNMMGEMNQILQWPADIKVPSSQISQANAVNIRQS